MTTPVRITFLGGVDIRGAGGARGTVSSRTVMLLAYLVGHAGTLHPRAEVAGVLWPESDRAQARTNLRRELHHLRALLGDCGALQTDGGALAWAPDPDCTADVQEFLLARDRAQQALEAGDAAALDRQSGVALALYRGAFLPGCYDDWAMGVREDLHQACLQLCDQVVTHHLSRGDAAAALPAAQRRVQLAPLEERGHQELIRVQRAIGDRAGAMRSYHRCAALLERELGVAPSKRTRAELDALLVDWQGTGDGPGTGAHPTGGVGDTAPDEAPQRSSARLLVGRDTQRRLLAKAWQEARHGTRFLLVAGEAGAGKTRLVTDLAVSVGREGAAVATARCFVATAPLPLAPVAEWMRSPHLRMATSRLAPMWAAEVARLVPGRDAPEPAASGRATVDSWQRVRFFEGLARAVAAVDHPLLLTLDDLQWCDKATLSWLSFLLSYARTAPVLVVATVRQDELDASDLARPLAAMRDAGQCSSLDVAGLTPRHTAQLLTAVAGRAVGDEELELVMTVTDGNPFHVLEAVREAGATPYPLRPSDLRGVLASRVGRLPDASRQVLELASAVGRDFTLDLLTEASDLSADTIARVVDDLWRRGFLDEQGSGYDIAHDLLREAAYEGITPPRRWLLHRRLAQALELLYADQLDAVAVQLADQYDRGGQPARALPFYSRGASRATEVFAHAEAVRLWQRYRDLLGQLPAGRSRDERELEVLQQLLPPLTAWQGYAAADLEAAERRASELAARLQQREVQASAAIALFATTFVQGHTTESHAWARRALGWSGQRPQLTGQAHLACAGSALSLGQVSAAAEHFDLACRLAGGTDSLPIGTRTEVHGRCWSAHAHWLLGKDDVAAREAAAAVDRARDIEHPYSLAVALAYSAITHQLRDDLDALGRALEELTGLCDRYDFAYYREWAVVLGGWLLGTSDGTARTSEGIAALQGSGSLARMPYWLWLLADLHHRAGQDTRAVAVLDAAISHADAHEDRWWLPEVLRSRATLAPERQAVELLGRAVDLATRQSSTVLLGRAGADLRTVLAGAR